MAALAASERAISTFANGSPAAALPLLRAARARDAADGRVMWRLLAAAAAAPKTAGADKRACLRDASRLTKATGAGGSRTALTAATLLECIVLLRCGDITSSLGLGHYERAVELARQYGDRRPTDEAALALLAVAAAATAAARIARRCAAEGGGWALLLPHPLACVDCGSPAAAPVTNPLGWLRCGACANGGEPARAGSPGAAPSTTAVSELVALAVPTAAAVTRLRTAALAASAAGDAEGAIRLAEAAVAAAGPAPPHAHAAYLDLGTQLLGGQGQQQQQQEQRGGAGEGERVERALAAWQSAADVAPAPFFQADVLCARALVEQAGAAPPKAAVGRGLHRRAIGALLRAAARATLAQVIADERCAARLILSGSLDAREGFEAGAVEEDSGAAADDAAAVPALSEAEADLALDWCRAYASKCAAAVAASLPFAPSLPPALREAVLQQQPGAADSGRLLPGVFDALQAAVAAAVTAVTDACGDTPDDDDLVAGHRELAAAVLAALAAASESVSSAIDAGRAAALTEREALQARGWALSKARPVQRAHPRDFGGGGASSSSSSSAAGTAACSDGPGVSSPARDAPSASASTAADSHPPVPATPSSLWSSPGFAAFQGADGSCSIGAGAWPPVAASTVVEALQCGVCFGVLYEPVTLPHCQHSLCRACVMRALDHRPECPMCRQDASAFLRARTYRYPVNFGLLRVALAVAPGEMADRAAQAAAEREEAARLLPIFVCSLALPGQEAPLHIFEPRYRLMMRRALEDGSRCFGMAAHTGGPHGYPDVGTVMRIRSMELLPDGRSLVDCVAEGGDRGRFRVVERSARDGYNVARVEWLVDSDAGHELEGTASDPALAAAWTSLQRFAAALLTAVPDPATAGGEGGGGAFAPGWRTRAVAALAAGAPIPPAVAAAAEVGLLVLASGLDRHGRPPAAPEADPQRWLWWLCVALPVGDARKYEWLAAPSWAARVTSAAEALERMCGGSALAFVEGLGAHVSARGLGACGVQ